MLYRILRSINAWYAIGVLWICIGAFLLAFALMFVFPQGTLLLLFLGLGGIGLAVIFGRVLQTAQDRAARGILLHGQCPLCREPISRIDDAEHAWQCVHCGAAFSLNGAERQLNEAPGSGAR